MNTPTTLRQRAELYQRIETQIGDPAAIQAIREVVSALEIAAEGLERRECIREHAHAIWVSHGRPHGRDVEFWHAAEREVDSRRRR